MLLVCRFAPADPDAFLAPRPPHRHTPGPDGVTEHASLLTDRAGGPGEP
jgi:hypothetical protein